MSPLEITLTAAQKTDCRLIWEWRNEEVTRQNSFNSSIISWDEHQKWYSKKITNGSTSIFIIQKRGKKIGYLRFNKLSPQVAEVSISLDKAARGKGYGAQALQLACNYMFSHTSIEKVLAHIKTGNRVSRATFSKAKFVDKGVVDYKQHAALEMVCCKQDGYTSD